MTTTRRTVLVTGGSEGIGAGLAERWLARGDRVLVTGRSPGKLAAAAGRLPGLETVLSDAGDPRAREELADHLARVAPELDVVVHNAGTQRRVPLAADRAPWEVTRAEVEVLLGGPVHLDRLLLPRLVGAGRPALVVLVTSGGAFVPQPFAPVYSALKAALHSYAVNLRFALARTAVRVQELAPPAVATALSGEAVPHGVGVDEFCDAVFPQLTGGPDVVGYGPTAASWVADLLALERGAFETLAGRFAVERFG